MTNVFIGSARGRQLDVYRRAAIDVCHRLHLQPVYMEDIRPGRPLPIETCRRLVDETQVFVLLIGHRYGSRPVGESLSFTELEYLHAMKQPAIDIHVFAIGPDVPWAPKEVDSGRDGEALAAFLQNCAFDDRSITQEMLAELARVSEFGCQKAGVTMHWRQFWRDRGDYQQALSCAEEVVRLLRDSGAVVLPSLAKLAEILVEMERPADAEDVYQEVVQALDDVHPGRRPYLSLAKLAERFGHDPGPFALAAYGQAWCEGPPFCLALDLETCREHLKSLGLEPPALPTVDPSTVVLPYEAELRRLIEKSDGGPGRQGTTR